jgi:DUF1009 family protein
MKAPRSKRARKLLADEDTAQKMISAVRKGSSVEVEARDGTKYIVRRSRGFNYTNGSNGKSSE